MPKIEFRYSGVYDDSYRNRTKINELLKERGKTYPSVKKIRLYIERVRKLWQKRERKVLEKISELSGLKWKEQNIRCYVIGFGRPFSDPLTLRLYEHKEDFMDTLTHELIHQMQIQNHERTKKWFDYVKKEYANESKLTKSHIFLHALHTEIYLQLLNRTRLEKNIKEDKNYPDYNSSWEIVQKEGHQEIIKEFKKRTR